MRYLLDTHTFLWWITGDSRLSPRVGAIVENPDNEILLSVVSAWEISIKVGLGRLKLPGFPDLIPQQLVANGFVALPVAVPHALEVSKVPLLHRDPFDRMLVAQAWVEDLPVLTADQAIAQYDVSVIW